MIFQTCKMAWKAICANKLRTFLTMLGIIIGVSTLIVLVSIADGASSSVTSQISDMGSNYLMVRITDDKENPLKMSEFSTLLKDDAIAEAAPIGSTSVTGKSGYTSGTVNIYGTTGGYFTIMEKELLLGRTIKKTDIENNSYVIIITADTAIEFFGRTDVEGENISLDGKKFLVIGVLEDDSSSGDTVVSNSDSTETVELEGYIPYTTLTRMADNILEITQFYVSSSNEDSMDEAMAEVDNTLSLMLGGIAAISLLVGGIGIMNIMLVSVTERTREIGIRKAIGAGQGSIMLQFLIEAIIVSMAGCGAGIIASAIILKIIQRVMGNSMSFQMNSAVVLIAVAFSAVIGILFGIYPARKAQRRNQLMH